MKAAIQLYSLRKAGSADVVVPKLAQLGVTAVEAYGALLDDVDAWRSALDRSGIRLISFHIGLDALRTNPANALDVARSLGVRSVFVPFLAAVDRPDTADGYGALAREVSAIGGPFRDAGIGFGWHNHDFELQPLADGALPLQVMFDAAPDLSWEADLAWVVVAGADPFEWLQRFGPRVSAVHVKDVAPAGENLDEDGWADLGQGRLDWPALLRACRALPQDVDFILEHDNPKDPMRYVARSCTAFTAMWDACDA